MKIAFVSSEVFPFSKTGGLADVSASLPVTLSKIGIHISVFSPFYAEVKKNVKSKFKNEIKLDVFISDKKYTVKIKSTKMPDSNAKIYFVDYPEFFNRKQLYTSDNDEHLRFVLFQKSVLTFLKETNFIPDIIHVNDWQTSLIPYYLKTQFQANFPKTKSLITIHNIGYQGVFDYEFLDEIEIAENLFYPMGPAEFFGRINFLKMGLIFSDSINTVSKTYAKELLLPNLGGGMENILKQRQANFYGILNGVDYKIWSPETDILIPKQYSFSTFSEKKKNNIELKKEFGISSRDNKMIIGMITRLVSQKGFDLLIKLENYLIKMNANLVILGNGEKEYEDFFFRLQKSTKNIKIHIGYNNNLAHLIEAGSDAFLMPSLYEPCGLNQIYSLKYGTIPIVRKTGGLADTVLDWDERFWQNYEDGNGFSFVDFTLPALQNAIERGIFYYQNPKTWMKIVENAMKSDFSWDNSAKEYKVLYESLIN